MRDYVLRRFESSPTTEPQKIRLVPPGRSRGLRRGGGRKDRPGWTEQNRKTNRKRFNALRPFVKTGVTVIFPRNATPLQLSASNDFLRSFCKQQRIPARGVWEGPGKHTHLALGIPYCPKLEAKWQKRLQKHWLTTYGTPIKGDSFLWKPAEAGQRICSYLSKTWEKPKRGSQQRLRVKAEFEWLTFTPTWETGFKKLRISS